MPGQLAAPQLWTVGTATATGVTQPVRLHRAGTAAATRLVR